MKKTIPFYIESKNGHDTKEVREGEVQKEVEDLLNQDKWVTKENESGDKEILTKNDLPKEKVLDTTAMKSEEEKWAEKFENTKSVTATNKASGG